MLYGDKDEVFFLYSDNRSKGSIEKFLKKFRGVLLSDAYVVYENIAKKYHDQIEHALCWAHTRREFFEALSACPVQADTALEYIKKIYAVEEQIREQKLTEESKHTFRLTHSKHVVEEFFEWLKAEELKNDLLPSNRFSKAVRYALHREEGLKVFLENPDVQVDTNHLERALRPIPMGRKNWLFCWTEVGAEAVAVIQTLIASCKLHHVNPFEYFVDVLQQVDSCPQSQVAELTPRNWALRKKALRGEDAATA